MKTYHNEANTGGITNIALKCFFDFFEKVQNCKILTFKVNFLCQKLSETFYFFSLKNIDLGQQLLSKTFFDKFNSKNYSFPKLNRKIVNFLNLSTLSKKLQKIFQCNFCDSTSISFIVITFHQIPLT